MSKQGLRLFAFVPLTLAGALYLTAASADRVVGYADVSLRDYIDRILQERETAHRAEIAAAEKTLLAANESLTARLEAMNQFRAQIQEERLSYVRKDQLEALGARVVTLENRAANLDGRFWALGVGLTIFTVLLNLATRFVGRKLSDRPKE